MAIAIQPILMQSELGQIGANIAGGLGVLQYAPYAILAVILIVGGYLIWQKRKHKVKGENMALIYSIQHKNISDIKPFVVIRETDEVKNIENTKAVFPSDIKKEQGGGGIFGFFKNLFNGRGKKDISQEPGAVFSESLATFNEQTNSWLAVWTLETGTQVPIITAISEQKLKFSEIERSVEKRITKLKTTNLESIRALNPNAALSNFGKLQIICVVIIAVSVLALAYGELSLSGTITTIGKQLATVHIINLTKP